MEKKFNLKIKCIKIDNEKEFSTSELFVTKEIIHQCSYPYISQQNGVVEKKHQHILNVTRFLRIQVGLPQKFWMQCVLHVVYLINHIPSPIIKNKTLFELLFNSVLIYNHLKVLCCLYFSSYSSPSKFKFDIKALKYIFLICPSYIKGYKVYDLQS